MYQKKILYILLLTGFIILGSCAGRHPVPTPQKLISYEPDPRAMDHFVDGVIYDLQENFTAALLAYQTALLYDSSGSSIYLAIAKDYIRLGEEESALKSLAKCLQWDPQKIEALDIKAKIYVAKRNWRQAEETYREIIIRDSLQLDAYYSLALLHLQRNEKAAAVEMYGRMLSYQHIPNPQILIELGELYINMKHFEDAIVTFNRLAEVDSTNGYPFYGIGMAQEAQEDTSEAIKNYVKALQLTPDLLPARDRLSRIYASQQRWEDTLHIFSEAISRDSTDLASWLALAETYRFSGDPTNSLQILRDIKRRFPRDWRSYLAAGRILLDEQKFAEASHEFRKIIELSPRNTEGWLFTGICLVHLDSLESSQPYLRKAVNMVPQNPMGNYYLGSVLSQTNRSEEAIPYLETALEVRPGWIAVLSSLATVYESLKDYVQSDSLFNTALELDPENALILNNYGYSLSERGVRLEEALQMAHKALEIEPENGSYLDTMGWIYYQMEEYEKALEYIEAAHAIRKSLDVTKHLGDVYHKLGMNEKAREAWKKALELDKNNPEILKRLGQNIEE